MQPTWSPSGHRIAFWGTPGRQRPAPARDLGLVYARLGLGDSDGALDAAEAAVETNLFEMLEYGLSFPVLDPLRASPRFAAILRRLNLDVARLTLPDAGRSR